SRERERPADYPERRGPIRAVLLTLRRVRVAARLLSDLPVPRHSERKVLLPGTRTSHQAEIEFPTHFPEYPAPRPPGTVAARSAAAESTPLFPGSAVETSRDRGAAVPSSPTCSSIRSASTGSGNRGN